MQIISWRFCKDSYRFQGHAHIHKDPKHSNTKGIEGLYIIGFGITMLGQIPHVRVLGPSGVCKCIGYCRTPHIYGTELLLEFQTLLQDSCNLLWSFRCTLRKTNMEPGKGPFKGPLCRMSGYRSVGASSYSTSNLDVPPLESCWNSGVCFHALMIWQFGDVLLVYAGLVNSALRRPTLQVRTLRGNQHRFPKVSKYTLS